MSDVSVHAWGACGLPPYPGCDWGKNRGRILPNGRLTATYSMTNGDVIRLVMWAANNQLSVDENYNIIGPNGVPLRKRETFLFQSPN